jgi:hypothetical protein
VPFFAVPSFFTVKASPFRDLKERSGWSKSWYALGNVTISALQPASLERVTYDLHDAADVQLSFSPIKIVNGIRGRQLWLLVKLVQPG